MSGLLNGLRILSIEQYGAGPYGTMLLADLGAEVVKIESPEAGGDVSRATGPYFLGPDDSLFFQTFSKGKKSVALDLKTETGRALFEKLVGGAEVVANNLRGDQPAKLGLRHEDLARLNPAIVCAHLSAYGRDNPRAAWPGYDYLMQAEAGFLSVTGEPDGPPVRFGLSMVDFMTGAMLAAGILAGVLGARRSGRGCDVDVALFDTALHQLSYPATWYLNEGAMTGRLARGAHPSIAPSQLFRTADGWVMVMCQTPKFWEAMCRALGREDLLADPRFIDIPARAANRAALTETLDAVFSGAPSRAWFEKLGGITPIAPVHDVAQALDSPYAHEIGMIETVPHPGRPEGLRLLSSPFKIDGRRPKSSRAPLLDEHGPALRQGTDGDGV
jgi:crotonobetainyl-CoA:carnitine CoA-transferase CaiB-like acyl-CoA transferase